MAIVRAQHPAVPVISTISAAVSQRVAHLPGLDFRPEALGAEVYR